MTVIAGAQRLWQTAFARIPITPPSRKRIRAPSHVDCVKIERRRILNKNTVVENDVILGVNRL
jgi:hypothetical protein